MPATNNNAMGRIHIRLKFWNMEGIIKQKGRQHRSPLFLANLLKIVRQFNCRTNQFIMLRVADFAVDHIAVVAAMWRRRRRTARRFGLRLSLRI